MIDARELRTSSGRYVERLLHYLQDVDKTNTYLVLLKPKDMDGWKPKSKRFTKIACPYKEFTFAEQIGLLKQIKSLQPDLVHFPFVQQPILYRGLVVTTMQDLTTLRFRNPSKNWLIFTFKQWVYKWVNKIAAHKSAALITPTQFVKDDVARFARINSRKITVTYEAADHIPDEPQPVEGLQGTQFIMYVGRPLPHKNLDRLIEAFALIKQTRPELKLVLAGKRDTLYKRHEKRARELGTDVVFTGFVSEGELKWLYQNTQAYVFPSLSEGFGLPALEAMVHGAPVVSSDATCLPEVYGDAAVYFDPENVQDMAEKITKVISNENLRQELIKKGHKQAGKYSWRRMAEQTLEVYNQVLPH